MKRGNVQTRSGECLAVVERRSIVIRPGAPSTLSHSFRTWLTCNSSTLPCVLARSGLRLRLGFHAGLLSAAEVNSNAATGRAAYSGVFMAVAREVSNAGPGGCVMMSEAARRRLVAAVRTAVRGAAAWDWGPAGCPTHSDTRTAASR